MSKTQASPKPVAGRMIITCEDQGGVLVPRVTFDPIGKINPGWFDRYQMQFVRAIMQEQVTLRRAAPSPQAGD